MIKAKYKSNLVFNHSPSLNQLNHWSSPLQQQHFTLTRQLRRFESSRDGLTPLGRKLLVSQDELEKQDEEKQGVRQDVQENELRQRVLKAEMGRKIMGFRGKVYVRKVGQL